MRRSPKWDGVKCSIKECERDTHCRGLCRTHYNYLSTGRDLGPIIAIASTKTHKRCLVDACPKPVYCRQLCHTHYKVADRGGRTCSYPGCNTAHLARNYCQKHYSIWYENKVKAELAASEITLDKEA